MENEKQKIPSDPNMLPENMLRIRPIELMKKIGHVIFDHLQSPGLSDHARHEVTPVTDCEQGPDQQRFRYHYGSEGEYL